MLASLARKRLKMVIFSFKVINSVHHGHLIVLQINKDTKRKIYLVTSIFLTISELTSKGVESKRSISMISSPPKRY
jgi:hypothetical protein